jgi:hypothetical protein
MVSVIPIGDSVQYKIMVEIAGDGEALENLPELLKHFRAEAKKYGLLVGQ